jgi:hypothetical protein
MKNGFLYDGETLDMVWPERRPFPAPFWVTEDAALEALRRQ